MDNSDLQKVVNFLTGIGLQLKKFSYLVGSFLDSIDLKLFNLPDLKNYNAFSQFIWSRYIK
jgi:hypothetical protein